MRIGIDLDDVLVDFIRSYTQFAHEMFGVPEGIVPVDWDWSNYDLSKEQHGKLWDRIKNTRNFWLNLKRAKGVTSQNLRTLAKRHDVLFITARIPTKGFSVQQQAAAWLSLELGLKYPTVIEEVNKGPLAAALRLDYFIDDRPKNCLEIQNAVPTCLVYLKESSHNTNYKAPKSITRVKDFNTFAELVLKEDK